MYLVNGRCFYSGDLSLAASAAHVYAASLSVPGYALQSVTADTLTSAIATYTDGTDVKNIPITLHYASDSQCAFAGDFAYLSNAAVDLTTQIIFTIVGGLLLCCAILFRW